MNDKDIEPYFRGQCGIFGVCAQVRGEGQQLNRWEVHSNQAAQSELLVCWWKMDLRPCRKNSSFRTVSVSGAI